MKMITIKMTILLVSVAAVLSSCKKDFLERNPLSSLSSEVFWQNEEDVKQALAGVYTALQGGFYGSRKVWLDAYSDNAYDRFNYYGFQQITQGIVNSTNVPWDFYGVPYRGIARCNFFLDNIGKASIGEAVATVYAAEVRFLRAMFYFDLVQCYGGVVLYKTAPASVDESKMKQSSAAEVLSFVNEELDFAIANLPNEVYDGHAVKASAEALRARVALYQQDWPTAATLTGNIIADGKFSVWPEYEELFNSSATQFNNTEIIFSTRFLSPNNVNSFDMELGNYAAVGPYQNLVDEYETLNGKMINDPSSGYDPEDPYTNRDPRLYYTIQVPTDIIRYADGTLYVHSDPLLTGYAPKKYVNFTHNPNLIGSQLSDQHVLHTRYADVLLMYAEAKNELSGPDPSVYSALNQIRQRPSVNLPPVDEAEFGTQETLREFIRHERRVELALEGTRYYDLKRWDLMEEKLSAMQNPGGVQLSFGEANNVLPFSLSEVTQNPQLDQNDGYK